MRTYRLLNFKSNNLSRKLMNVVTLETVKTRTYYFVLLYICIERPEFIDYLYFSTTK